MFRHFFSLFTAVFLCVACQKEEKNVLKVGVTSGPHAQIAEKVVNLAKEQGMNVKIVYFDDFIQPNAALDAKEIDINIYQHQPFLGEQVASRGYKIKSMAKAILLPLGIYGGKNVKSLSDVKDSAKVLIPSDPTNGARALLLLQEAGLMKLGKQDNPTPRDIVENPKNLQIVEIEAPLLPRVLQEDADLAVINADWVIVADMDPKSALFTEKAQNSPYTNLIVVREGEQERADIIQFVKIYQSNEVKAFIEQTFKGAVIAAW